jgi:methyl halide transferase
MMNAMKNDVSYWNDAYVEGVTPWDKGAVSPPLKSWLTAHESLLPRGSKLLVPGCGPGHEVGWLHDLGFEVYGLDAAAAGLALARKNYPQVPIARWLLQDLFALPEQLCGAFDAVVEHTCLSALPPVYRADYARAVMSLLRPGGLLVGCWYVNPDLDPGEQGPPFPLPVAELEGMFPTDVEVVASYVPKNSFPGREGRELLQVLRRC